MSSYHLTNCVLITLSRSTQMNFPAASAPDIIRSNQKDFSIEFILENLMRDFCQSFFGTQFIHRRTSELKATSRILYLSTTLLAGTRTLGEEYTDIFCLNSRMQWPNFVRKLGFVLSTGLSPFALPKIRQRLSKLMPSSSVLHRFFSSLSINCFSTINLIVFYFFGVYYQFSKRLFGLRYASGHKNDPLENNGSYEFLGILMVIQAMSSLFNKYKARESAEKEEFSISRKVDLSDSSKLSFIIGESRKCNLCLEPMKSPAATPCGHVFCWDCSTEWCRSRPECPLCRQTCTEQNLLLLLA